MTDQDLIMDSKRLQKMRPDLYPKFLEILKSDAPYYHNLIDNTPVIDELLERFGGKMTVKVSDLPPRARI